MDASIQPQFFLQSDQKDFSARFEDLLSSKRENSDDIRQSVLSILSDVAARGDAALLALTQRFDRHDRHELGLAVSRQECEAAASKVTREQRDALEFAAHRIRVYHEQHLPSDHFDTDTQGIGLGWRWTPVDAAGVYVPGGTAAYPSTLLMNVIPAQVAGVGRIAMVTPLVDGLLNPLIASAADLLGIEEIYAVGGAQAIGALAFGTETIDPVDCIVGPGNAYVAAAKREVYGRVAIDQIAGPSEILIVADQTNNPQWLAADLLSQAEHDPSSQAILITDSTTLANQVASAIASQLSTLPRQQIASASWHDFGAIVIVRDLADEAPRLANALAAEHVIITAEPPLQEKLFRDIRHAGAIFLGPHTPETLSDYVAGPNHVLPTARSARFSSGLGVLNFMKRTSILSVSAQGMKTLGGPAVTLAKAEGLEAHARAVQIRSNSL